MQVLFVIFEVGMNIFLQKEKLNYIGSLFYWLYNINTWTISNPKILFKVEQDLV
jgi:hypothetical protein